MRVSCDKQCESRVHIERLRVPETELSRAAVIMRRRLKIFVLIPVVAINILIA